jgi:hypothetical protein
MNEDYLLLEAPDALTSQKARKLAPQMIAWNTALVAVWLYLALGEFVVARNLPEFVAFSAILVVAALVFCSSENRYGTYLAGRTPSQRTLTFFHACGLFFLLLLLAILFGSSLPESLAPPMLLLSCCGMVAYRTKLKRRWFKGLMPAPIWQTLTLYLGIGLVTLISLTSGFSG